jgi:hypothetical protein
MYIVQQSGERTYGDDEARAGLAVSILHCHAATTFVFVIRTTSAVRFAAM